ncbi:hypothetical protein [Kitasatospora sp. NPDC057198]|uniref:hypothetical protein n=1 Tax=Kitasatospora sp. NPDC057198 TaxID=3346046 RepID=UPI00362F31B4
MDEQDEYRAATERTSRGTPTPKTVVVAYTVALVVLLVLITALIASGRSNAHPRRALWHPHTSGSAAVRLSPNRSTTAPLPSLLAGQRQPDRRGT